MCVTEKNTKKAISVLVRGLPESIPIWGPKYPSPTGSELGGGSDSSDIQQDSSKNSSFWGSSSSNSAVDCSSQARGASFAPPTPGVVLPPGPIPLPTVAPFTLPAIKNTTDYLQTHELILYWLRRPGCSTACSDSALITDSRNALASQFWEGQIWTALKEGGDAQFLFENTGTSYYDRGFEMLQVLKDHYRPSSISNMFTTFLSLFNDKQKSDAEGIHEFCLHFEGNLSVLGSGTTNTFFKLASMANGLMVGNFLWLLALKPQSPRQTVVAQLTAPNLASWISSIWTSFLVTASWWVGFVMPSSSWTGPPATTGYMV